MSEANVLNAAGPAAQAIAGVSWALIIGAGLIFVGVMLLLAWSLRGRRPDARAGWWLLGGGVVLPVVVLSALFVWTLPLTNAWRPALPPGALVITVTGHLWWWEVRYDGTGGEAGDNTVVTANEIHIPVGRPVYLALASADVIHSFWVPSLAGKRDMLPGRIQHLELQADRAGRYRGVCAEYCGEQHARMALTVVAEPAAAFDVWLKAQAQPAREPLTAQQVRGRDAFLAQRCDACHTVRGVGATARLGPDLTHIGSRAQLAAGSLDHTAAERARWIAHVQQIKAGARMPSYDRLDADTLAALADWLGALK